MLEHASATSFATTADGQRLPVIDISNPRFIIPSSDHLDRMKRDHYNKNAKHRKWQRPLGRLTARLARRLFPLAGAIGSAPDGYMPGLATYLLKLGPENLPPPYDNWLDRWIAGSIGARSLRLRLEQVATLLAEALAEDLQATPGRPVHLVDIAGGTASSTLNALLLLARSHPALLAGTRFRLTVYDLDTDGPSFALGALQALRQGPLAGIEIDFEHVAGRWDDMAAFEAVLAGHAPDAIVACVSEGGLFDYGTDADVAQVLETAAPRADIVVGSLTPPQRHSRIPMVGPASLITRTPDRLVELAPDYRLVRRLEAPYSLQFLLRGGAG